MKVVKAKEFTVKLSECGQDSFRASYKIMRDKSALKMSYIAINTILEDFVGRENSPILGYDLACALLGSLGGWDKKQLMKDINLSKEELIEKFKLWEIK